MTKYASGKLLLNNLKKFHKIESMKFYLLIF